MEMTLMNINQAADFLGLTVDTLRNWCKKRQIPYYKLAGMRFNKEELVDWVKTRKVEPEDDLSQKADEILNRNANERKAKGFHK